MNHRRTHNTLIGTETYGWNAANELASKIVDGVTTSYTYDWSSQLLTESRSGYNASYTYDANGNRTTRTVNGSTETYAYDSGDELTAITGGSDPGTFAYDDAGRMTQMARSLSGTKNFTYDYEGRITQITKSGMTTNTFTYDGLNTRVGKVDSLGTATYRRDGTGVTDDVLSDGTRSYTPGVSQRQGTSTKFVLDDYLGTTGRLLDSSQNVTDTFTYDAFGVQTARTGTTVRPFGCAGSHGYQEDGDTGLKLLGHRYYDPTIGRFLTRDPIQDGRNWYAYCDNNPLSKTDADGLKPTALTDDQKAEVQKAIDLIRKINPAYADQLQDWLNAGWIWYDSEKAYNESRNGHIFIGRSGFGNFIELVAILVHELQHVIQHMGGFPENDALREVWATIATINFLTKLSSFFEKRKDRRKADVDRQLEFEKDYFSSNLDKYLERLRAGMRPNATIGGGGVN